jgi:hypothetical protein
LYRKWLEGSKLSQITVRTRVYQPSYHRLDPYCEHEITGEILNTIKWLKPDEMAVTNPAHPNGFSILHKKNILWIKDLQGKKSTVKIDADYKQWTVKGSKGNSYLVIRQKGQYNCTCPGYTYRKSCRHIVEVGNE